jgi:hypothetical protein
MMKNSNNQTNIHPPDPKATRLRTLFIRVAQKHLSETCNIRTENPRHSATGL